MAKKKKITATQRKLKNARERAKYRLEKKGFSKDQITYLLQDFRKAFTSKNKAGKEVVNVGKLTSKQIDKRLRNYTLERGGVKINYKDLLDRIRDFIKDSNKTTKEKADDTYYLFMDAFGDEWIDNYEEDIKVVDINEVLRKLYANIGDKDLREQIQNSIDMMIKDDIERNIG